MMNMPDPLFTAPQRSRDRSDRLIPMINVVFLLLSFFMIAGTIRVADGLAVDPPQAATQGTLSDASATLLVQADGTLALNGTAVSHDQALARLAGMHNAQPDLVVQLKADRRTTAKIILPLLQDLNQQGIKQVELVATKKVAQP